MREGQGTRWEGSLSDATAEEEKGSCGGGQQATPRRLSNQQQGHSRPSVSVIPSDSWASPTGLAFDSSHA